jgi:Viral BACON domain/Putative binding domain, N-terminal
MHSRLWQVLVVAAIVGVGGSGCGHKSPTEPTPVCEYAISPGSLSFGSEGGTGSVTVSTLATCTWTATSSAAWIAVTAGGAGSGPGSVAYSVAANAATESRSGTLTIGGHAHAVAQLGRQPDVCTYELSPATATVSSDGGSGTFAVSARGDCAWTATSNAGWLVISSGSQGSGNGTVSYTVGRHSDPPERTAAIAVADKTFSVRQSGAVSACDYSVAPVTFNPCMPGGTATATLTTQAGCSWTATSDVAWLGVPSGSSGIGPGTITITFSDNYDSPREGIVMVRWPTLTAGQNLRVAQAGCLYGVSRSAFSFESAGGTGTFDVLQQSEPIMCGGATQDRCVWTARSDVPWITITSSMPRSGDNPVAFAVAANPNPTSRTANITVQGKVVAITQAGR